MARKGEFLFSDRQEAEVARLYGEGFSLHRIGDLYGANAQTVLLCLRRLGVPRRTTSEACRKYRCNHRYWEAVDTEEKAYWLGFFAADGNVRQNNVIRLALQERDLGHLMRFREALRGDWPVRRWESKRAYRVDFSSPEMAADLLRWGCPPAKTSILRFPPLDGDFLRHWVRGFADGDGCFYAGRRPCDSRFKVSGNLAMIETLRDYFSGAAGAPQVTVYLAGLAPSLSYSGAACRKIADFLYHGATVYLERKYRKAYRLGNET